MKLRAKTLPHYFEGIKSGKKRFDYRHIESITFVNTETGEEYTCKVESVAALPGEEAQFYINAHQDCKFVHNEALYEITLGDRMNGEIESLGEYIGQTVEGDYTSGVWLILKRYAPEPIKGKFSYPFSHPDLGKGGVSTKGCLRKNLSHSEPATELMRFTDVGEEYNSLCILTTQDGKMVGVDSVILDYFSNHIENFRVEISPDSSNAIKLFSGASFAGITMPLMMVNLPGEIKERINAAMKKRQFDLEQGVIDAKTYRRT